MTPINALKEIKRCLLNFGESRSLWENQLLEVCKDGLGEFTKTKFDKLWKSPHKICLWQEDAKDRERLGDALKRFWPHMDYWVSLYHVVDHDEVFDLYSQASYYTIACSSYPGNSSIWVVNHEK